ncbi:MAG TPA: hypothetical protein VJ346_08380 [Bacteroidales bacterium]|nr:hypothetical protein [Bacteroidales bacterium]
MKNKILKTGILFTMLMLMNSCLEYEITTQVYPDGRIERYFKVHGDYDMILESSSIRLPDDSTWEIKTWWELADNSKSKPDSNYVFTARKIFKNEKELNKELKNAPDIYNQINIQVDVKRKFRWFFTFIKYKEIYQKYFPYNYFPSKDFLTDEEVRYSLSDDKDYRYNPLKDRFEPASEADTGMVLSEEDEARAKKLDNRIENKFSEWQLRNIFEDYCNALSRILSKKNPAAYQMLIDQKKEFFDSLDMKKVIDFKDDPEEVLKMKNYIISRTSDFLNLSDTSILSVKNTEIQSFFNQLSFLNINTLYAYNHKMIMPGKMIQTNSTELEDGNSIWKFALKDLYASDYLMMVESRIVNKWAIVISIVVVCLLLAGLVIGFIKR